MEIIEEKKLKIILVMPAFDKGGGERLVVDLANYLVEKKHQVKILCVFKGYDEGRVLEEELNASIEVLYVSTKIIKKSKRNFPGILSKLGLYFKIIFWVLKNKRIFYEHHIAHVHLTAASFLGTLIHLFGNKKNRCKIVETNHADSKTIKGIFGLFYTINRKFRDGLIFELRKEDYLLFKKKHPKVLVDYIPIGSSKPLPLPKSIKSSDLNESTDQLIIGQIGRLNIKDRRTDKYILLFQAIYKLHPNSIKFYMYGDGPDRKPIEEMIAKLGMQENIIIKGYTDDMAKALSTIDIYVTVNIGENCGVAGLQAIWSGIPTVAIQADETYFESKLDDIIPNSRNLDLLAEYIITLMDNEAVKNDLIQKQFGVIQEHHSIKSYCEKTEKFYYSVLNHTQQ